MQKLYKMSIMKSMLHGIACYHVFFRYESISIQKLPREFRLVFSEVILRNSSILILFNSTFE